MLQCALYYFNTLPFQQIVLCEEAANLCEWRVRIARKAHMIGSKAYAVTLATSTPAW
jgi:hypothetical protein